MTATFVNNVMSWGSDIEPGTIEQAERTARLPICCGHLALMPDAHWGNGATIGSVIPTKGAIIPSAVGVDIGCGMIAVRTPFDSHALPDDLDALHSHIGRVVPAGVGRGHDTNTQLDCILSERPEMTDRQMGTAMSQLGSLGSGNHFVEVSLDETDRVWVVLHSGSRGIGNQLAQHHIGVAKGVMASLDIKLEDPDLAYVIQGTQEFNDYIGAMLWAQDYAMVNRDIMMKAVLLQLGGFIGFAFDPSNWINCHHNFAALEQWDEQMLWITRKGAIQARIGDLGVIPGSMGSDTFIVEGLGNPDSYSSCAHGAGRRMSRGAARRSLDVETLMEQMKGKAWNYADAKKLIDEDPRSYKDVDAVMEDQRDLVTVQHRLTSILNYKGL